MNKFLKNIQNTLKHKAILSCIITITVILSNTIIVKGIDANSIEVNNISKIENTRDQHQFIIDSPVKFYDDIKKVEEVVDFKFKLPDFFPKGYKVNGFELRKFSDKDSILVINFENKDGKFSLQIGEDDPAESLILIEREKSKIMTNSIVDSSKQPMKIGEINGLNIILTTTLPARQIGENYSKESKTTKDYFTWKDQGIWYSIEYNSTSKSEENSSKLVTLSSGDIEDIAKSLKYLVNIKNIDYSVKKDISTENPAMNIYDIEDVKKAKNILGFDVKFPLVIDNDINITSSVLGVSKNSDIKNNKIIYELNNFYSYKNGSIMFSQSKDLSTYEELRKNEYIDDGNGIGEVNKVEKININNNEILKYSTSGFAPQVNYIWNENSICYNIVFFVNIQNSDEIVKEFINLKTIE